MCWRQCFWQLDWWRPALVKAMADFLPWFWKVWRASRRESFPFRLFSRLKEKGYKRRRARGVAGGKNHFLFYPNFWRAKMLSTFGTVFWKGSVFTSGWRLSLPRMASVEVRDHRSILVCILASSVFSFIKLGKTIWMHVLVCMFITASFIWK